MKLIILLLFLAISGECLSQPVQKLIDQYFKETATGKSRPVPQPLFLPENTHAVLNYLKVFGTDTSASVRARAYAVIRIIGTRSDVVAMRQRAATDLVVLCKDSEAGNIGLGLDYLTEFKPSDFSQQAKDTLIAMFKRRAPHFDKLIRLLGYLEVVSVRNELRAIVQQREHSSNNRWSAMLALARMGDDYAKENIMARIERLPVNDEVTYSIFPDLIYTRQKTMMSYLINVLNTDTRNCSSANPESDSKVPCAYRVMEMLAPVVEGYPLKVDDSGDVDTQDYPGALVIVRDWFKTNPDFKIVKDSY